MLQCKGSPHFVLRHCGFFAADTVRHRHDRRRIFARNRFDFPVPAPETAFLKTLKRDFTREGVRGGKRAKADDLIGAMCVDCGRDLELSILSLEFILMFREKILAKRLTLFPDAPPALRIAFRVFPSRFIRPVPRQDLIVLPL